ncbi:hypothetical protein JCM16303_002905 [Sporobolomyces ruberrimus]
MPVTTFARTFLYAYTITVTLATLGVAAAFIHQISEQFYGYYEPSAELLAASVILVLTLPILHFGFHLRRGHYGVLSSLGLEVAVLFVLWALFLGGAAATTSDLGQTFRSRACSQYLFCGLGKALEILAWLSWAGLTLLLFLAVAVGIKSGIWDRSLDETVRGGNERRTSFKPATDTTAVPPATGNGEMSRV